MSEHSTKRDWLIAGALGACAIVLGGVLVTNLTRPAQAMLPDVVASSGDFAVLSSVTGVEDAVIVLDQRAEEVLLYLPKNQNSIEFKGRQSLKDLFTLGKANAPTAPKPGTVLPTSPIKDNPSR